MKRTFGFVVCAMLAACSDDSRAPFTTPTFGDGKDGGDDFAQAATPCEDVATHVYVLSDQADLYRFRPGELAFEKIGHVSCDPEMPNSMAVDRFGTAWVNYRNGSLYRVSTRNAACLKTEYRTGQGNFTTFGSAFVAKTAGSADETLFADGESGSLSKIDLGSMKVSSIGSYDSSLSGKEAELTGTGDGRLYGFFTTSPNATLARIDQVTAQVTELRVLEGVNTGNAYAFSFWGGDFWFYTSSNMAPSTVTRLRTTDDKIEVAMPNVGFRIVGAGVSTCAPLTAPR